MQIPKGLCQCGCGGRTKIIKKNHTKHGHVKGEPMRFCRGHYNRGSLAERFWEKVNKNGPVHPTLKSRCWLWTGTTNPLGYGRLKVNDKPTTASHVAWFLTHGVWPTHQMNHHCDNPPCVRSSHLFDGTSQDGVDDKVRKNRQAKGETNGRAKLTAEQIRLIRTLVTQGMFHREIAKRFNVGRSTISHIAIRKSWAHMRRRKA